LRRRPRRDARAGGRRGAHPSARPADAVVHDHRGRAGVRDDPAGVAHVGPEGRAGGATRRRMSRVVLRRPAAMRSTDAVTTTHYDEFGLFHENAEEFGIEMREPPAVERVAVAVGAAGTLSALRWGTAPPELVLLHGGAQNAHTWDT